VTRADLESFDLVLAMDDDNFNGLTKLASAANRSKVVKFCSLCTRHPDREVPDPYYGGAQGFEHVLDLMEDGCGELLARILAR
jgi:protein-tyrosine phosphatase